MPSDNMKKAFNILVFSVFCFLSPVFCFAQEDVVKIKDPEMAGEFFGMPVSMDNYRFAKAAILIFGPRWGGELRTPEEIEGRVWEDLLMSYEAFRRDVRVETKEAEDEVAKLLEAEKVDFDWKKDREAYTKWVLERVKEPAEVFENQIRHLLQLQKLRTQIIDSIVPVVTEEEAYQEYLDQYNTLGLELVQFDDLSAAEDFYKKMKNPKAWDKKGKKDPKFSQKPGFVSSQFLMDIWKIPRADVYAMLDLPENSVYKPSPVYRGYGVFRTLQKRVADKEKFNELRQSYFDQIKRKKQFGGFSDWLNAFKKDAKIKVFIGQGDQ
ncbi:MAG TPA: hypothetical protein DCL35_05495 [Candidatus Omnitrophica bacterium]|nr:hypothetical protein [Candidatus Omnitrophota bacterium]